MKIIEKSIAELKPYEKNPRKNDNAVKYVAESIRQFGFKVPIIVDKNNVIVCGHTRYKAAQELGIENVPCIIADDLTDEQIKAFRLADNKVSEKAEWDFDLLSKELLNINDIDMSDFDFYIPEDIDSDLVQDFDYAQGAPVIPDDTDNPKIEGKANEIFQYNIIFDDANQKEIWSKFLVNLKSKYEDMETIAEKLIQFIKDNGGV